MIEIDRVTFDPRRRMDQSVCGAGIELKPGFDQAVQLALLDRGGLAVERDDMNQQRRRRQTISGIVERAILIRTGGDNVGNELAKSVEHQHLYRLKIDTDYMARKIRLRNA